MCIAGFFDAWNPGLAEGMATRPDQYSPMISPPFREPMSAMSGGHVLGDKAARTVAQEDVDAPLVATAGGHRRFERIEPDERRLGVST